MQPTSATCLAQALVVLAALCTTAWAYPNYFIEQGYANSCTDHPSGSLPGAPHGGPVQDSGTTFTLFTPDGTTPTAAICPGQTQRVQVTYSSVRRALITVTTGAIGSGNGNCPNRLIYGPDGENRLSQTYTFDWSVPCDATGSQELKSTSVSALGGSLNWLNVASQPSVDVNCAAPACGLNPTNPPPDTTTITSPPPAASPSPPPLGGGGGGGAQPPPRRHGGGGDDDGEVEGGDDDVSPPLRSPPPASTPKPSPSSPPPSPRTSPSPTPTPTQAPTTQPQVPDGSSSDGCTPSSLGYQCMQDISPQVRLHWSVNTTAAPGSDCRATNGSTSSDGTGQQQQQEGVLHVAAETTFRGYLGLSFAQTAGVMSPADAIVGYIDNSGVGNIATYHVTSESIAPFQTPLSPSWAYNMAVTRASGGGTTICFSRKLNEPAAKVTPRLRIDSIADGATALSGRRRLQQQAEGANTVAMNWAVSNYNGGIIQHSANNAGGLNINLASGSSTSASTDNKEKWIIAHGALMAAAWVLLLPLGVLFPSARWLFGDAQLLGSAAWFRLHVASQVTGTAVFIAGIAIAFQKLGPGVGELFKSHRIIGIIVLSLASAQVVLGFIRPKPDAGTIRTVWNAIHHTLGRVTILLAWANVYIGIVLFHRSIYLAEYAPWLGPVIAVMGTMMLLYVLALLIARVYAKRNRTSWDSATSSGASAQNGKAAGGMHPIVGYDDGFGGTAAGLGPHGQNGKNAFDSNGATRA